MKVTENRMLFVQFNTQYIIRPGVGVRLDSRKQ